MLGRKGRALFFVISGIYNDIRPKTVGFLRHVEGHQEGRLPLVGMKHLAERPECAVSSVKQLAES